MNRHRAIVQGIQSRRSLVSFPLKLTCLCDQSLNLQRLWQVSTSLETIYSSHRSSRHEAGYSLESRFYSSRLLFLFRKKNLAPRSRPLSISFQAEIFTAYKHTYMSIDFSNNCYFIVISCVYY